jgi:hypothetical protein
VPPGDRPLVTEQIPESLRQTVDVVFPAFIDELARVAPAQRRQLGRQLVLLRPLRAVDEDGDDLNVRPLKRPRDLAAHEVSRLVQPAVPSAS